jgi:leader peptidase (prepilin peptidase)/N-methyltransferase
MAGRQHTLSACWHARAEHPRHGIARFGMLVVYSTCDEESGLELSGVNEWFYLISLFLFGLVFGSFGNVVIWRLPRGENLSHPGSHCPKCDTPIHWYDNVPVVSWLLLRGRCRSCANPISPRYPLVELLSGFLWLGAGLRFGFTWSALVAVVFFYVLQLLAFIDWDTMRLPNSLVLTLFVVGAVGAVASQVLGVPAVPLLTSSAPWLSQPLIAALVGAVAASGLMLATSAIYSAVRGGQGYGMGDIKLLAVIGLYVGLYSLMTMFFATLIGAVYGAVSARRAGEGGRHKFPFGPFIALAAVGVTFFGPALWAWYSGLAGIRM